MYTGQSSIADTTICRVLSLEQRWDLLGCAWLQLLVLGLICLTWIIMTANIGGHTKRSVANGLWFVFFGAGNIGGAHVSLSASQFPLATTPIFANTFLPASKIFLSDEKPRYPTAITVLYICYAIVIVTTASLWAHMYLENKRRDRKLAASGKTVDRIARDAILAGLKDTTDKQSLGFRYVY